MEDLILKELIYEYPNDYDLGDYIREYHFKIFPYNSVINELVREYPNDHELGKRVRQYILEK